MDNDVYGHVNNVVYYSFFDTAVNATLIEAGVLDPVQSPVIGLVVETGCRFAAPLSFPADVHAGIRVAKLGSSSVRYEVGLFDAGEALAAAGRFLRPRLCRSCNPPSRRSAGAFAHVSRWDGHVSIVWQRMTVWSGLRRLQMFAKSLSRTA